MGFLAQCQAENPAMLTRFAVFLGRDEDDESAITFGGHMAEWADSELFWAPVVMPQHGFWQVEIKAVRVEDTVIDDCSNGGCRAILDSGASHLSVPWQVSQGVRQML